MKKFLLIAVFFPFFLSCSNEDEIVNIESPIVGRWYWEGTYSGSIFVFKSTSDFSHSFSSNGASYEDSGTYKISNETKENDKTVGTITLYYKNSLETEKFNYTIYISPLYGFEALKLSSVTDDTDYNVYKRM